jgi:hypothetical protein
MASRDSSIPGLTDRTIHEDVVLELSFRDLTFLLQGEQVHLGHVPNRVEVGNMIFVSVPDMKATYIVEVVEIYKNSAYGRSCVEHFKYLPPTS